MILYDIINKKIINVDNIDFTIKNKIINNKIRIVTKTEFNKKKRKIKYNNI